MIHLHSAILRRLAVALTCILNIAPSSAADDARIPTPAQLQMLPAYCPKTQIISTHYGRQQAPGNHDAQTHRFIEIFGNDFWHLHHYCFGLTRVLQAQMELNPSQRKGLLEASIGEYDYVIRGVRPNSIILPELHMQKGISLIKLKRGPEGVNELQTALRLNPSLAPAYRVLSDYYKDSGNKDLAIKTLEKGLSVAPDNKALKRRYAELGGTKTFEKPSTAKQGGARKPIAQ